MARGHDVAYVVIGEGEDRSRLTEIATRIGVADRVRFVGFASPEILVQSCRMADLFVMPSTSEGFGLAYIEAMACGTPALGLAVGGARDALGNGELGTALGHEDDLAAAIDRLLVETPRNREALADATRARFGRDAFAPAASPRPRPDARPGMSERPLSGPEPILVLEPGRAERHYWRDIWAYRELFAILAWRDVAIRYKQTVIGVAWAVIRPFLDHGGVHHRFRPAGRSAERRDGALSDHGVCRDAAVVPVFDDPRRGVGSACRQRQSRSARSISLGSSSRAPSAVVALVDFVINLAMLFGLMSWFGYRPELAYVVAAGLCRIWPCWQASDRHCCITALNVKYRDFRYIIPFIVQFGLYVSPVGFSSAVVPEQWRFWYSLNPVVGVIDGFRWCILGGESQLYLPGFLLSLAVVAAVPVVRRSRYFRRTERSFADLL